MVVIRGCIYFFVIYCNCNSRLYYIRMVCFFGWVFDFIFGYL